MSESVFQPEQDGITDDEWQALLARASNDGRRFFSENQLYLAYARNKVVVTRQIARRGKLGLCIVVLGIAAWVYALKADAELTLVIGIALTLGGVGLVGTGVVTRREPASREPVARWLTKWTAARGLPQLITEARLSDKARDYVPPQVACVVLVERDPVVDLLLENGAHRALSALIVAESGYPEALASEARRQLEAHPELRVIAVHDATFRGIAMPARLRESPVFPLAQRQILDAGLFPADVTWLSELAPAIPAAHTSRVPLDSLSYDALLLGLRGVAHGALSLYAAIDAGRSAGSDEGGAGSSSEPETAAR
jgi:hypothetical protein